MKFMLTPDDLKNPQRNNVFESPTAKCLRRYLPNEQLIAVHDNLIRIGDRFWETPKLIREYMWNNGDMPPKFELDLDQKDGSPGHEFT